MVRSQSERIRRMIRNAIAAFLLIFVFPLALALIGHGAGF